MTLEADLQWLVWSNEHQGFWRMNRHGYTRHMGEAARFSVDAAQAICDAASLGGRLSFTSEGGHKVPPEIMVLAPGKRSSASPETLAAQAVAEFTDGRSFPGNERLERIIAASIRFDRENRE